MSDDSDDAGAALRAGAVDLDRERGLTIVFGDGHECFFANELLRAQCPCATCRGMRDRGVEAWPAPGGPSTIEARGAELVGNWGINIEWSDGHSTGIYPFSSLREWCDDKISP